MGAWRRRNYEVLYVTLKKINSTLSCTHPTADLLQVVGLGVEGAGGALGRPTPLAGGVGHDCLHPLVQLLFGHHIGPSEKLFKICFNKCEKATVYNSQFFICTGGFFARIFFHFFDYIHNVC